MNILTAITLTLFLACLAALLAVGMARQGARCWRSFAGRRGAFAAVAILCAVCMIHAQKRGTISFDGDFIRDAGSYATNDVLHVAATNAPQAAMIDLASAPLLVYRRPCDSTNAADWVELMPRRTFGELPADWQSVNATNYNYLVYLDYVPPSPVHTNGVWQMRGFEVPGMANAYAFPNTRQERVGIVPVEYLESTGTQWIDTEVSVSALMVVEMEMMYRNSSIVNDCGYIARINEQWERFHFTGVANQTPLYGCLYQDTCNSGMSIYNMFRYVKLDALASSFVVDTKSFSIPRGQLSETGLTWYIFARNSNVNQGRTFARMLCKWCKLYNDSILIRDFIPVRVGRVGYMYDRVSGRLFGNSGTGAFIVGPDIRK